MNKNQKILTVAALAIFAVIIALHYIPRSYFDYRDMPILRVQKVIENVTMWLFVLAVFYTGLFFLLNDAKDHQKRPQIQQKLGPPKFRPPAPSPPPRELSPAEAAAAQAEWEEYLADWDAKDADPNYHHDPWEGRP